MLICSHFNEYSPNLDLSTQIHLFWLRIREGKLLLIIFSTFNALLF